MLTRASPDRPDPPAMTTTSFTSSTPFPREGSTLSLAAVVTDAKSAPDPTTTTTTTPLSISTPYPTSHPQQPGAFISGGAPTSLLAGCISIAAFASAFVLICTWCRYAGRGRGFAIGEDSVLGRFVDRVVPARFRRRRGDEEEEEEGAGAGVGVGGLGGEGGAGVVEQVQRRWGSSRRSRRGRRPNELSNPKPEMADAWIETVDDTWGVGRSVPLSATLFPTGPAVETAAAEVPARAAGRDSVHEEEDGEKERSVPVQMRQAVAAGSSTLQVAVLLQMPSPPPPPPPLPPPSHTVTEDQNDVGVRRELVIGLVEAPWTREHPSSREGEATTTS